MTSPDSTDHQQHQPPQTGGDRQWTPAERDLADLRAIIALVNGLIARHTPDISGPALTAFGRTKSDLIVGAHYIGVDEVTR